MELKPNNGVGPH